MSRDLLARDGFRDGVSDGESPVERQPSPVPQPLDLSYHHARDFEAMRDAIDSGYDSAGGEG